MQITGNEKKMREAKLRARNRAAAGDARPRTGLFLKDTLPASAAVQLPSNPIDWQRR